MGYDPLPWEANRKKIIQFTKMMMMMMMMMMIIIVIYFLKFISHNQ